MAFNGQLRANEIFSSQFNMIISQLVLTDNIKIDTSLANRFREEGTLFGDTKLFTSTDSLRSHPWTMDDDSAYSLLTYHRPEEPITQAITIDTFRQIPITVDQYMTKRAFMDEGGFSQFTSVILGWSQDTKKIHDYTMVNSYVGTVTTQANKAEVEVKLDIAAPGATSVEKEAINRLRSLHIGKSIADILDDLRDVSRDFNDYGFIRSYELSDFLLVFNSKYDNEIRLVDLPTVFHKDGVVGSGFEQVKLQAKYWGNVTEAGDVVAGAVPAGLRLMIELDYTVAGAKKHGFAGDLVASGTLTAAEALALIGKTYIEDDTIICKLVHKQAIPFMSAFEAGTEFWNAKNLSTNHYLTWGYSSLQYLKDRPIVKFVEKN